MTQFHQAILSLLDRAGGPCSLPYLDRHLIGHFDIDLVVRGLLPAALDLERDGFVTPTAKHGYAITDAGRRQLALAAAALPSAEPAPAVA